MKQVVCINPRNYRLTQGREYTVANNPVNGFYNVTNDRGSRQRYSEDLFRDVVEEVIPDSVDTILNSTTLSVSTINDNYNTYTVIYTVDGDERSFNFSTNINKRLDISCGINAIDNVNAIMSNLLLSVPDRNDLRVKMLSKVLVDLCLIAAPTRAITLISTNISGNGNIDFLRQAIEVVKTRFRVEEVSALNQNSNNAIVLYSIISNPILEEDDVEDIVNINQLEE